MQEEIFKDIPNYEGPYQVSNLGNVKSLNYASTNKEKLLKQINHKYLAVHLYKNKKLKTFKVHSLVYMTFKYEEYKNKNQKVIDHINNNQLDNRLDNLQLISNRENLSKDRKSKTRTSKYIGVNWKKANNKWCAQISIKNKRIHLGLFEDEHEAHLCYQNKLKEINETY